MKSSFCIVALEAETAGDLNHQRLQKQADELDE
jgi:hypothetical protein